MYALDAGTGAILWSFASGGSVRSGAAIVGSQVYWGSGYPGGPNKKMYAFRIPAGSGAVPAGRGQPPPRGRPVALQLGAVIRAARIPAGSVA